MGLVSIADVAKYEELDPIKKVRVSVIRCLQSFNRLNQSAARSIINHNLAAERELKRSREVMEVDQTNRVGSAEPESSRETSVRPKTGSNNATGSLFRKQRT